jgi:hypothetical protein
MYTRFLADNKSTGRSTQGSLTAIEHEEELMGLGQLPRDVATEEKIQEEIKKAIGPPPPTLE